MNTQAVFFKPAALLAEATATAGGLTDFGDPTFRPALDAVCRALEREGRLSELGRQILRQKLVGHLSNRLRIEQYFKDFPEIANEVVGPHWSLSACRAPARPSCSDCCHAMRVFTR